MTNDHSSQSALTEKMEPRRTHQELSGAMTPAKGSQKRKRSAREPADESDNPRGTATTRPSKITKTRPAGIRSDTKSFLAVGETEARVGAYVGFNDISKLQTFLITHQFPKYYVIFDCEWSKNLRVDTSLELIRDIYLKGDPRGEFSLSFAEIEQHKPSPESAGKTLAECDYLERYERKVHLAQILIQIVAEFTSASSGLVLQGEQAHYSTKLKVLKSKHVRSVPDITGQNVDWPTLRPVSSDETDLEPFNRAFNLLKCLAHNTSNEHVWAARFEKADKWNKPMSITPDYIPSFMIPKPKEVAPEIAAAEALKVLPKKKFVLSWRRLTNKTKRTLELNQYLEDIEGQFPLPPPGSVAAAGDPRVHDPHAYRDALRLQCNCTANGLQLHTIFMTLPIVGDTGDDMVFDIYSCDWDDLIVHLSKDFTGDIKVVVTVMILEDGDELMECRKPPAELQDFL